MDYGLTQIGNTVDVSTGSPAVEVGYYRHPDHDGETVHACGYQLHEHGWIDSADIGGDGLTVCPSENGPFRGEVVQA